MGTTIKDVCLKSYQFSCWNFNNVNRNKLLNLSTNSELYDNIPQVVEQVLNETRVENTQQGSTHYHARSIQPK
ncbi:unnamed protein product [Rotaria sp. Silwood1]|nr:unnamed protein product [Rotaria sp. Silwood1]